MTAVRIGDVNGNGLAEIFVTSVRDGPRSFVLEWTDGNLGVVQADLRYFLSIFPSSDGTPRLVGQASSGGSWPFAGERYPLVHRDGRSVSPTPEGMRFFDSVVGAIDDLDARLILELQEELTATEGRIAFARQAYNDSVMDYNTLRESFPNNLFAGWFNFRAAELLEQAAAHE